MRLVFTRQNEVFGEERCAIVLRTIDQFAIREPTLHDPELVMAFRQEEENSRAGEFGRRISRSERFVDVDPCDVAGDEGCAWMSSPNHPRRRGVIDRVWDLPRLQVI